MELTEVVEEPLSTSVLGVPVAVSLVKASCIDVVAVDIDLESGHETFRGVALEWDTGAVIVINDRANTTATRLGRGVVTIVPVTSNTSDVFPFQTLLPTADTGPPVDSKTQAEQIRSVTIERLGPLVARLPPPLMAELEDALRLHLHHRSQARCCARHVPDRAVPVQPASGHMPLRRGTPRIPRVVMTTTGSRSNAPHVSRLASTIASLISGCFVAVSSVRLRCRFSSRKCANASARSVPVNSAW